jgi:hypothetical protein
MAEPRKDFPGQMISALLMISERRLQQLAAEGWIPSGENRGEYPLVGAVQGYIRYKEAHGRETGRGAEHSRLARAQAVKVEMENYRRAGEYILKSQVHELLTELMTALVGGLEGIPGRTANEFAGSSDPAYIRQRQQDEHRIVRSLLADRLEKFAQSLEDSADTGRDNQAAETPNA